MKRIVPIAFGLMLIACSLLLFSSWGFYGHRSINRLAIYTLPSEMMGFYKANADYLSEHSVDPDKRRHSVPAEAPRHYLDADRYEQVAPLDTIPHSWNEAAEKFSEDTMLAYGIGPWHLEKMMRRLQNAFSKKDSRDILKQSAEVGHYTADLCVPLHASLNYDGELSGQKGIHGFWESRLPELFAGDYDFYVGKVVYLEDVRDAIWQAFEESFAAKDSVLQIEKELSKTFPEEKQFSYEEKGNSLVKVYSREYSKVYHEALNGMVERRMRRAIYLLGCLWYTAWVNAGSPDLGVKMEMMPIDTVKVKIEQDRQLEREHE